MNKREALEAIKRLMACCEEALTGEWDRSDDGFQAMWDELDDLKKYVEELKHG